MKKRAPTTEEKALVNMPWYARRFAIGGMMNLLAGSAVAGLSPLLPEEMLSAFHLKAHIHFLTLGFFTFMIYGLGYHMLPKFCGRPLKEGFLLTAHELCAHIGIWTLGIGWMVDDLEVVKIGAALSFAGFAFFAVNLAPVLAFKPKAG